MKEAPKEIPEPLIISKYCGFIHQFLKKAVGGSTKTRTKVAPGVTRTVAAKTKHVVPAHEKKAKTKAVAFTMARK